MTDRELLELAAKAAGYEYSWSDRYDCAEVWKNDHKKRLFWQPHRDDGDALRLAVELSFTVKVMDDHVKVGWPGCVQWIGEECAPCDHASMPKATRRAIVRAAAEIGRSA